MKLDNLVSAQPDSSRAFPSKEDMGRGCGLSDYAEQDFCRNSISVWELVNGIISILNARDAYTYQHSTRVAGIAEIVGYHLGFRERKLQMLRAAARLHDIGKIGVPDYILRKKGGLSEEEFAQMKRHPQIGADILNQIALFKELAPWVRDHHERWDGKGYPNGIAGQEIGLASRVLAVADTLDAITSQRPYRAGMPFEHALCEIEKNSGSQFCPEVARCVLGLASTLECYLIRGRNS